MHAPDRARWCTSGACTRRVRARWCTSGSRTRRVGPSAHRRCSGPPALGVSPAKPDEGRRCGILYPGVQMSGENDRPVSSGPGGAPWPPPDPDHPPEGPPSGPPTAGSWVQPGTPPRFPPPSAPPPPPSGPPPSGASPGTPPPGAPPPRPEHPHWRPPPDRSPRPAGPRRGPRKVPLPDGRAGRARRHRPLRLRPQGIRRPRCPPAIHRRAMHPRGPIRRAMAGRGTRLPRPTGRRPATRRRATRRRAIRGRWWRPLVRPEPTATWTCWPWSP